MIQHDPLINFTMRQWDDINFMHDEININKTNSNFINHEIKSNDLNKIVNECKLTLFILKLIQQNV